MSARSFPGRRGRLALGGLALAVLAGTSPAVLGPAPEPGPAAVAPALAGKSKGRSVKPRGGATQPGRWARFKSFIRGRRAQAATPSPAAPLANPLQGMRSNRLSQTLVTSTLARRSPAPGGPGVTALERPGGGSTFTVTAGGARAGAAGRNGALTAARSAGAAPAPPADLAPPPRPATLRLASTAGSRRVMQQIPDGLQARDPVPEVRPRMPRRTGNYQSVSELLASTGAEGGTTPRSGGREPIVYEALPPSKIVYGKLPSDPVADSSETASNRTPSQRQRDFFRTRAASLDAQASDLTAGLASSRPRPPVATTASVTPAVRAPAARGVALTSSPMTPSILTSPTLPASHVGGPGRVRGFLPSAPPAGAGSGTPPTLAPARVHPTNSYFI